MSSKPGDPPFSVAYDDLEARLRALVQLDLPYDFRPIQAGRPASVMLLCALSERAALDGAGSVQILMTRRTERVEKHKGQYALPGGLQDPEDGDPRQTSTLIQTALRETMEEMGIESACIQTIGTLPPIWTPSGFYVTPVVGVLKVPLEQITVVPSEIEIDLWFWTSLGEFQDPETYTREPRQISYEGKTAEVLVDVFQIGTHRIWGATGSILKNFIGRWEKLR